MLLQIKYMAHNKLVQIRWTREHTLQSGRKKGDNGAAKLSEKGDCGDADDNDEKKVRRK